MRMLVSNNEASAVPLILFFLTIFVCGALYTYLFVEVGFPLMSGWIPASDYKIFIMMGLYAIPLFVVIVGILSLLLSGLKYHWEGGSIQ